MQRALTSLQAQMVAAEQYAETVRRSWFLSDAERSVLKNIADERVRFDTWRNVWRSWAISGVDPSGRGYTPSFWLRIGGDIASALKTYSGALYNADWVTIVKDTVVETGKDVGKVVQPMQWPTWAKVAAGVAVLAVAVVTINNAAALARGLRG